MLRGVRSDQPERFDDAGMEPDMLMQGMDMHQQQQQGELADEGFAPPAPPTPPPSPLEVGPEGMQDQVCCFTPYSTI